MSQVWARYYSAAGDDPRPTLVAALDSFEREPARRERFAVDLGCGSGRDTFELLRRGWSVLAIDSEARALELLRARDDLGAGIDRLETRVATFEAATWPAADLVNSSFALPFCSPEHFGDVWERINSSLPSGGGFCGQLFGERDEWASRPPTVGDGGSSPHAMTFHTRDEVDALLQGFDVESLDEIDEDGTTAVGDRKHWHLFHIVARKR